jgi:hypothetical protein
MSKDRDEADDPRSARELGFYSKELGRPLQRKLLQQKLDDFSHSRSHAAHGDDAAPADHSGRAPDEGRAG